MVSSSQSILIPIIYSDIFDFPLHIDELWRYVGQTTHKKKNVIASVIANPSLTFHKNYVCLKGKEANIKKRIKNQATVAMQQKKAKRIAQLLGLIPWILCICLSGSLAAGQYKKDDDIDLFIITKSDTLWLSRLLLLGVVGLLGKRRKKGQLHAPGSICMNLFIDTKQLDMSILGKDMYIAREIAQLQVLFNRHNTFEALLKKNAWIRVFVAYSPVSQKLLPVFKVFFLTGFLNKVAEFIQRKNIEKTRTKEIIGHHIAAFHPGEYHAAILAQFEAKTSTIPH